MIVNSPTSFSPAFDLYRCIAVLAVVLGHFALSHPNMTIWIRLPLMIPMNYGVPIFFLISGYLLAKSYQSIRSGALSAAGAVASFYRSRLLRIYPAYLFWLIGLWALGSKDVMDFVVHLLNIHNFYPSYVNTINPVFWSLSVEFQWYILAPALIEAVMSGKIKIAVWVFSLSMILSLVCRNVFIHAFFYSQLPISELSRLGSAQIYIELYSFVLGILVFRFRESKFRLSETTVVGIWLFLIGVSVVTLIVATSEGLLSSWMLTAVVNIKYLSQFALAALMFHYRSVPLPSAILRPVRLIALVSYSLYLVHLPILDRLNMFTYPLPVKFFIYLVLSVLVALLSYRIIEKPAIGYARQLNSRLTNPQPLMGCGRN